MNNINLIKHSLNLTLDGYRQMAFINSFLKPFVKVECEKAGYQLTPSEKKKVLFYYPMYSILGCAEMYTALRGRGITLAERSTLTLVAAWATLCDDLVDDYKWTRDQVFDLIFGTSKPEKLTGNVQLLSAIISEQYRQSPPSDKYISQLKIALEMQSISEKQLDANITTEEIITICREKNGHTSLMFATLIDEDWTEKELEFIYQSAIVGQLTNDSFDLYFDTQNGINTVFNTMPSILHVRQFFINECRHLHDLVRRCSTTEQNKQNTISRMSLLHGFTLTALDQLADTEKKYGLPIDWKSIPRKDIVIDMALNKNRLRTIKNIKWLASQ